MLSDNRQAGHNFFLLDRYEAGIALTGTEVKAAKAGKVQLRDAYAAVEAESIARLKAKFEALKDGGI